MVGLFKTKLDPFQRLAVAACLSNAIYIVWLAFYVRGALGGIFLVLETLIALITFLFTFNHWRRRFDLLGGKYSLRASVDIFIPTVNEPLEILHKSVAAAAAIDHPRTRVFVLDDGNRSEVRHMAESLGCTYLTRPDASKKRYKANNLNFGMKHSSGNFILTIDADNVVSPGILDDLLGHFRKKDVGIVASRQSFTTEKYDFNHDHLFYNYMQSGKNADGAAISCGSGVIYRRSMLEKIGGFSEWNLVEDLHTTYVANALGYRSIYVTQPYVLGLAPSDLRAVYKQRGTWALDTLRIFFWQHPMFNLKLTLRQRLHYLEMCYSYLVSGIFLTAVYFINFYTLLSDDLLHVGGWWYVVFRLPALIFTLMLFNRFSQGQLTSRIWAGMWPVYAKATILALMHRRTKPLYRVTPKIDNGVRELSLVVPQIMMIIIGYSCIVIHLAVYGPTQILYFSTFWTVVMSYWMWAIIMKAAKAGIFKHERAKPAAANVVS